MVARLCSCPVEWHRACAARSTLCISEVAKSRRIAWHDVLTLFPSPHSAPAAGADASDSSDSDSDSDDEEDDTAALLRELEKIKRERAEEKARNEAERSAAEQSQREDDIALGNPLLNLENAMKGGPGAASAKQKMDFGVKRRWDDDVIFKNQ